MIDQKQRQGPGEYRPHRAAPVGFPLELLCLGVRPGFKNTSTVAQAFRGRADAVEDSPAREGWFDRRLAGEVHVPAGLERAAALAGQQERQVLVGVTVACR